MSRLIRDVELRCFPRGDRAFVEAAERAVAEYRASPSRGTRPVEAVQSRLRERYPEAEIHPREPIAEPEDMLEPSDVWYVYRNGRALA